MRNDTILMTATGVHGRKRLAGLVLGCLIAVLAAATDAAALTITPNTWNIIGLDSNTPALGPNRFPVGAKVCGLPADAGSYVKATFTWDAGGTDNGTYINLRTGSLSAASLQLGADGCAYVYFEAEVARTSAAFDKARRYHISAEKCTTVVGGSCTATDGSTQVSTPTPRELYVEHLVSQARNGIDDVKLDGLSIPAGGSMNLIVGNTYSITIAGHTAPGGYNQFEQFINIPNTIFQVLSVNTVYTANTSPYVSNPSTGLYADACGWENDPNSPYYLSCVGGDYKTGDVITTTYSVKILSGGGTSQTLSTLLYDLSGASFHYNSDYSTDVRIANIIDPTTTTIAKSFTPATTSAGGVSTLTFTLANPNAGLVSKLSFTDVFPAGMVVASPANALTSGCGSPTFSAVVSSGSITFSNGTIAANSSCTVQVDVTAASAGSYPNTSGRLFADTADTGKTASATLTVSSTPLPPAPSSSCSTPVTLATWSFDNLAVGANNTPAFTSNPAGLGTATAAYTGAGAGAITNAPAPPSAPNSWSATGWAPNSTGFPSATTQPYIDFVLDTSNHGGITISSQYYISNGGWASPANNFLYIYSRADAGAWNTIYNANLPKGNWQPISATTTTTGTGLTTIRINAVGAKTTGDAMNIDSVTFRGCTRPDANLLQLTKGFSPTPVGLNVVSTLTFTLSNLNSTSTSTLTGVRFADVLPSGLQVASTPNASTTCAGTPTWAPAAAATTLAFGSPAGASVAPGTSCSVKVDVIATTAGPHSNVSGFIYSAQTGTNSSATGAARATLTALLPPVISKQFGPNPILVNGVSKITFLITNPNQNNALSSVAFSDTLPTRPGSMVVANPTGASTSGCGAPTFAPVAGAGSLSFSNGTIAANGTCTVTVNVTAPVQSQPAVVQSITNNTTLTLSAPYGGGTATDLTLSKNVTSAITGTVSVTNGSATVTGFGTSFTSDLAVNDSIYIGTYRNITNAVTATIAGSGNTATDTLTVSEPHPSIALFKEVATTDAASTLWRYYLVVNTGDPIYYQFTVQNFGDVALTGVTVTDADLPAPLSMADCQWYYGYDYTDRIPANLIGAAPFTLEVSNTTNNHDSATCVLGPAGAMAGSHQNNASAAGTFGGAPYTDTDWAIYATTGLSLAKNVTEALYTKATDTLHYSYTVTNSGAAILAGPVSVSDMVTSLTPTVAVPVTCPAVSTVGDLDNYLDPGESVVCSSSYVVTAADVTTKFVTNTASASSTSVSGIPAATSSSSSRTVPLAPDLTAAKANNAGGTTVPGASFIWTLTVSNLASAGTATFTSGQVLLTDDMPVSGATYTTSATATNAGGTSGAISCSLLVSSLSCTANGPVTLPPGGSFSVPVSVTTTTSGTLANPGGGVCRADPAPVLPEIDETNNDCADSVTVRQLPSLTIVKSATVVADPFGGGAVIPGTQMQYAVIVTNTGPGYVDNDATIVTDVIPANVTLYVDTSSGDPVTFSCSGAPPCGLSFIYASNVRYTDQSPVPASPGAGCSNYTYTPAGVYDANVKGLCVNPAGALNGNNASFTIYFRVRVN